MMDSTVGLPDVASIMSVDDALAVRSSLPMVRAGHPLQSYKWALSCRIRKLRLDEAGRVPDKVARELIAAAGDFCPDCGGSMRRWRTGRWPTVDHITPVARGGTSERANLRVICNRCNAGKADRA